MNVLSNVDIGTMEIWQSRALRWMMGLSILFHAVAILFVSSISSLFPARPIPAVMTVELTDAPMSTLPEEEPPPPPSPAVRQTVASPSRLHTPSPPVAKRPSRSEQWLKKLDAGLAEIPEAPISRKLGKHGGIPVRHWETGVAPRPGDFAPAVAPENKSLLARISDLEGKVRTGGVPGVGEGEEVEISSMFGGAGTTGVGDPIPPWIRDMIRQIVRGHLPELEALYSAAIRRDPSIRGKLLIRFRIDPSGKVIQAAHGESSFRSDTFIETVLRKVRGWTFEPTDGRTVEVLYPFVFIPPS